jgi:hypothetical protein
VQNRIDIDHIHSRAIVQEIGERLRASLRAEADLPTSLRTRIDRFRELEGQSPSIVPAADPALMNEPCKNEKPRERSRPLDWLWRRASRDVGTARSILNHSKQDEGPDLNQEGDRHDGNRTKYIAVDRKFMGMPRDLRSP